MTNRYPSKCTTCGSRVPAGAGTVHKSRGRWVAFCAAHGVRRTHPAVDECDAVRDAQLVAHGDPYRHDHPADAAMYRSECQP